MASTLVLDTDDGEMSLFDAEPRGSARGGVVVVQEAFGVNDHIQDVCLRFAAEGYRAVSPHLFHRSGDPVFEYSNLEEVMPHMQALTEGGLRADLNATLNHLGSAGFEASRVGVVGFCMGGTVTFLAAVQHSLGAAATFYGGGIAEGRFGTPPLVELAPQLRTPWVGLFGDRDKGIPVEQVEALRQATSKAPVPTEVVRYAEAGHGFHCDARPSYHEPSAQAGWRHTLHWFAGHMDPGRQNGS
jgi:carboxymethylenebutenolidase